MTETATHVNGYEHPSGSATQQPDAGQQDPAQSTAIPEVTEAVRRFNAENRAHHDLWSRTRQATDLADRAQKEVRDAEAAVTEAEVGHRAIQAEHPDRRAPRVRQIALMILTIILDAVACEFAAQALGNDQRQTLVWTALFLAVLAGGEVALHVARERGRTRIWRVTATAVAAFIVLLGILRFSFLDTVGFAGPVAAIVGATLFTLATAAFVICGYRALRASETVAAWKARRTRAACAREARAARERAAVREMERDRLADAYLSEIRGSMLQFCTTNQIQPMEQAVRAHLIGQA